MDSLATVVGIAKGLSSPGDEWDLKFFDNEHRDIRWQGKFSSEVEQIQSDENYEDDDEDVAKVESESLTIDGKEVFKRNDNLITYNGEKLPQIEKHKSLLYVFRDDNLIEKVYSSLISIKIASSHSREFTDLRSIPLVYIKSDSTINDLINTGKKGIIGLTEKYPELNCREKLYYASKYDPSAFEEFEFIYSNIFPNVKKVKISLLDSIRGGVPNKNKNGIHIEIELICGTKVSQASMSSGMFKTMTILAELLFSSGNEVLVIDEIENSLGVNCLPEILSYIQDNDSQIILSTHHPKIINKIPAKFWRIVTRKGGCISTQYAEAISESTSKHDKFLQLINSDIYLHGAD